MATLGTSTIYPPELPGPQQASMQSAERRVLSSADKVFEARARQTDRLSFEEIAFPPFSALQAERFQSFWQDDLQGGALWFAATWWRPEGLVTVARRFVGPPAWEYIHTGRLDDGYWRVTATFEVRGSGELPVETVSSAWNPLDILSEEAFDYPLILSEDNYVATREDLATRSHYEAGVRGEQSRGSISGAKYYFEIEIISNGLLGDLAQSQASQIGIIDSTSQNVLAYPANASSIISASGGGDLILSTARFDGYTFSREIVPATLTTRTPIVPRMDDGDVYGFAWHVGTVMTIYKNGASACIVPFVSVKEMYPYWSAGSTDAASNLTNWGESARLRTGKRLFFYYPPAGYIPWG